MNLAKISTKVTFWSQEEQEEEELNSLVNRLLPREAGKKSASCSCPASTVWVHAVICAEEKSFALLVNQCKFPYLAPLILDYLHPPWLVTKLSYEPGQPQSQQRFCSFTHFVLRDPSSENEDPVWMWDDVRKLLDDDPSILLPFVQLSN